MRQTSHIMWKVKNLDQMWTNASNQAPPTLKARPAMILVFSAERSRAPDLVS